MDCMNYCRHVNSGNIPYQVQMYGACGCDYEPYYSNPMPEYNFASNYKPSYPMLQVGDLSSTVRTIPFNRQPDGTGIYYLPGEMQWPLHYQNSYVHNNFLSPGQMQNHPRGKLIFIPEDSPEMQQHNHFDFNIHQTAHIDDRHSFVEEYPRNIENTKRYGTPVHDDSYMDIGFRNLLPKNHNRKNKAKETLASLNMTANEHHLKNCLELTNLVKSRILHKEDEKKGNKSLLHKYKHLSNEAVNEEINKSCQHSSNVLENDVKTIKTFKRPINKEKVRNMGLSTIAPLRSNTNVPNESESLDTLKTTINKSKGRIEVWPKNTAVESSIESTNEHDKVNLTKNEEIKSDENNITKPAIELKSAGEEAFNRRLLKLNNKFTNDSANDTKLKDTINETRGINIIGSSSENTTTAVKKHEKNIGVIGQDGSIKISDKVAENTTIKTMDNEEVKEIEGDGVSKANDTNPKNITETTNDEINTKLVGIVNPTNFSGTVVNTTVATDDRVNKTVMSINNNAKANTSYVNATTAIFEGDNLQIQEMDDSFKSNDSHINSTLVTDDGRNKNLTEIDKIYENEVKATTVASVEEEERMNVNSDHLHAATETISLNMKPTHINDIIFTTTPKQEVSESNVDVVNETKNSDQNSDLIRKVDSQETKTSKEVNAEKLPQNKTEKIEKFDETIKISQGKIDSANAYNDSATINEDSINTTAKTTDKEHSRLMEFNNITETAIPVTEDRNISISNTNDSSNENIDTILKMNTNNLRNSTEVNNDLFRLSHNRTEKLDERFHIPQKQPKDRKEFAESTSNNSVNMTRKNIDENSTLMGLGGYETNRNDKVIDEYNLKIIKIPEEVNLQKLKQQQNIFENIGEINENIDEKLENPASLIVDAWEFDNLTKTTKAVDKSEKVLKFNDTSTTIIPMMDLDGLKEYEFPENKTELTEEFDSNLQVPPTERSEHLLTSSENKNNATVDGATTKTADYLRIPNKISDNNIISTVPTTEAEAVQSVNDFNSKVNVTPANLKSFEHVPDIHESYTNDSAKSLDFSLEESNNITLPSFNLEKKEEESLNKSHVEIGLDMKDSINEVISTAPSIASTSTESVGTTLAKSNDWQTERSQDGLNSLLQIRTLYHDKKGKEKNLSPSTDKDNKVIMIKMLPPNDIQGNDVNDFSETKEPDFNNDDESPEFTISTFETPHNMVTSTETIGPGNNSNERPNNLSYRRLLHKTKAKSEFNEEQKLLQNSFPNTTNSNHTMQSTKRHTTIGADSQENMNSRQYVATTNNPIKNSNKENRRNNNEAQGNVTTDHTRISDNKRIVPNIVTKETNRGIVSSIKDEIVSNEEVQGSNAEGETNATLLSAFTDESVNELGENSDDFSTQNNGNVPRNMSNKEVGDKDNFKDTLNNESIDLNNTVSGHLPAGFRRSGNKLLSDLIQTTSPAHSFYTQPILTGKMYFVQNETNLIPLKFIQKSDGNIALGIDGKYICKNLLSSMNDTSILLSVLCNKKIPDNYIPEKNSLFSPSRKSST